MSVLNKFLESMMNKLSSLHGYHSVVYPVSVLLYSGEHTGFTVGQPTVVWSYTSDPR